MEINNNYNNIADLHLQQDQAKINEQKLQNSADSDSGELEKLAAEFTSVLIDQMFSAMKNTLADDNELLDGGYAEDVFSNMLYKEYSQMAGKQGVLASLNQALVKQLRGTEGNINSEGDQNTAEE
ncbi:MAG: rod-binding protein [Halanaerobiales bacterium]|nr:rod-binding protein [Halanaerobiales bacterium]